MILQLKAKHFKHTNFIGVSSKSNFFDSSDGSEGDTCGCAIDKALSGIFGPESFISECIAFVNVNGQKYNHKYYESDDFDIDKARAIIANFDETIIREINIPGLKAPIELSTMMSDDLLKEDTKRVNKQTYETIF